MKKLILILPLALLTGCASLANFNNNVGAWWSKPATQEGVKIGEQVAETALVNFGLNIAEQEITGGNVNWSEAGLSAGSSAVRSLELQPGGALPGAIVSAVQAAVSDPSQAKAVASVALQAVSTATRNGADASGALEGAARAIDSAAATLKNQP